jgi:hypothetical protein
MQGEYQSMKHSKDHYRALGVNGYVWTGWDGFTGLHSFQKRTSYGYLELNVKEEDLDSPRSLDLMTMHGLSRN